ncbi:MAG: hypothetical protein ACOYIG_08560 [Acetivibrionales bacterium]|jgi:hypothetical protein
MIKGFKRQTEPLNEYELNTLLPLLVKGLRRHVGRHNPVISRHVVSQMRGRYNLSEARFRKIINHIRREDIIPGLVATSEGYYIAETEQELKDYEMSLLGREMAIREVRESITRQRKNLYNKPPKQTVINF